MISRLLRGLFSSPRRPRRAKPGNRPRSLRLEPLESRQLLTLVGIIPNFPLIKFDTTGTFTYSGPPSVSPTPNVFDMNATPLTFQSNATTAPIFINPVPGTGARSVSIDILVNSSGNLIGGNGTPNDFDLFGSVVVNGTTYSGELLTGHVLQFGWQYNSGTSTSQFDFRFQTTGGQLTTGTTPPFPLTSDIGVTMASEHTNSFTGSFETAFNGGAKGTVGPISPLPVALYGYKFDDLNDNGVDNSEPR